jgi:DNA-binding transcriptional LysR family regulator
MDRLDAMRVLLAVVDAGSISGGSRKLNKPLASVSRKVADLERHLGANLIVRTSRNAQLTEAGRDYVEAARKIMADLEEAERRASGEYQAPRGTLTITTPIEYGNRYVLPVVLGFMEKYPKVSLNLLSVDRTVDLVAEKVDIAIRLGELADSSLYAAKTGDFRLLTCASPAYLDRCGIPEHPRDLATHDGIIFNKRTFFWT